MDLIRCVAAERTRSVGLPGAAGLAAVSHRCSQHVDEGVELGPGALVADEIVVGLGLIDRDMQLTIRRDS